jgi:hypothetical protein
MLDKLNPIEDSEEIMTKPDLPSSGSQPSDVASLATPESEPTGSGENVDTVVTSGDIEHNLDITSATFPERLMELLEDEKEPEALWWLGETDCFCIDPKHFPEQVLCKYFQGTKFDSFTRKLNRWYVGL